MEVYIVMEQEYLGNDLLSAYAKAFLTKTGARDHINRDIETTTNEWMAKCEDVVRKDKADYSETKISYKQHEVIYNIILSEVEGDE